jgi:hypothetical protein
MLAGSLINAATKKSKTPRNALTNLMDESPLMNGGVCAAQRQPRMNCEMNMEFDACRNEHGTRYGITNLWVRN